MAKNNIVDGRQQTAEIYAATRNTNFNLKSKPLNNKTAFLTKRETTVTIYQTTLISKHSELFPDFDYASPILHPRET